MGNQEIISSFNIKVSDVPKGSQNPIGGSAPISFANGLVELGIDIDLDACFIDGGIGGFDLEDKDTIGLLMDGGIGGLDFEVTAGML